MRGILKGFIGRTVVVNVGGEPVRGRLSDVARDCIVIFDAEAAGKPVDGVLVVSFPVDCVQVVD